MAQTKLFSVLYLAKFLHTSGKPLFPRRIAIFNIFRKIYLLNLIYININSYFLSQNLLNFIILEQVNRTSKWSSIDNDNLWWKLSSNNSSLIRELSIELTLSQNRQDSFSKWIFDEELFRWKHTRRNYM